MNKKENSQEEFDLLRQIKKKPKSSQRELAKDLGFSLGKLNYCLRAIKNKGLIRSEGKDYIVQDGDIIHFRYNV
mgnify:CR=1 FL=1